MSDDIWLAAQTCPLERLQALLDGGEDVNKPDPKWFQWTPLHYAAQFGRLEVCKLLVEKGGHVDAVGDMKQTPLHLACHGGHVDVVTYLLNHNAPIAALNGDGRAPLHEAARGGSAEVVTLLLERNAQANMKDKFGNTAADLAKVEDVKKLITEKL